MQQKFEREWLYAGAETYFEVWLDGRRELFERGFADGGVVVVEHMGPAFVLLCCCCLHFARRFLNQT